MDNLITKYIPATKMDAIQDAYIDDDGYWITLREGWEASRTDAGCRTIHENRISDLKYQIAGIQKTPEKKTSEAQRKAIAEWVKSRDTIVLRLPKEEGAAIRTAAKDAGLTVTKYILECVHRERSANDEIPNED